MQTIIRTGVVLDIVLARGLQPSAACPIYAAAQQTGGYADMKDNHAPPLRANA
jgi:hypothetical protein